MPTYEVAGINGKTYEVVSDRPLSRDEAIAEANKYAQQAAQATRGNWFDAFKQGPLFGWTDELQGAGAYLGSRLAGAPHERAKAAMDREIDTTRGDLAAFRERNPWTAAGLEFAGGLGPGVGAMRAAKGILPMIGTGIAEGALGGAGAADENKVGGGLLGGLAGGTLAGALPGAVALAGKAGGEIKQRLVQPVMDWATKDPSTAAGRILTEGFEGMTPAQIAAKQRQLGPLATPADIGGPKVAGLAQGAVIESQSAMGKARELARQRRAGQSARLRGEIGDATGNQERLLFALDDLKARQRSASEKAYQFSNAVPVVPDEELVSLLNRPSIRAAIPLAIKGAKDEGRDLPLLEKIVMRGDDWQITAEDFPDMKALDSIKKTLDSMVSSAYRQGNPEARAMRLARDAFREKLDKVNPYYRKAREVYAGDAALEDAMLEGENFLNRKTREVMEFTRNLTDSEREAYLTGAVEAIREKMGRARSGEIGQFKFLEQENAAEKLRMLFPAGKEGNKRVAQIMRTLRRERTFAENETDWIRNSQTELRKAGAKMLRNNALMPGSGDAINRPVGGAVNAAMAAGRDLLSRQPQQTIDYVGDVLFTPNNQAQLMALLNQPGTSPATLRQMMENATRRMGYFAPGAGLLSVSTNQ